VVLVDVAALATRAQLQAALPAGAVL